MRTQRTGTSETIGGGARGILFALALGAFVPSCRGKRSEGADGASATASAEGLTIRGGAESVGGASGNGEDGGERHVAFTPTVVERAPRARAAERAARANETISIAAGALHVGSTPGERGRDPAVEADGVRAEMTAFDIDALPYPNDPAQPPRTGVARDEAARLCQARGRRLCRELEWERACKGPNETVFPNGDEWDAARCSGDNPGRCASGFGAMALGTRYAEWTADDIADRAVIRGASASAPAAQHRCSARRTATPSQSGLEVGFRCCSGAPSTVEYPREISRPPFREQPMTTAELSQIVATIPELVRVREGFSMLPAAAVNEVMNHGATTTLMHPEVSCTVQPVRWSPTFGEELLAFVGTSNAGSFVAALWVLPTEDGRGVRYRHAASFILAGDRVAMTLAHARTTREEVQWSACWNCGGEHGVLSYDRETARVIAVQR
jgi:formylglycine-generating enzyme required for sulfatase activity